MDKISFATSGDLQKINRNFGLLKENPRGKYGGLNILLLGNFAQHEPISGYPLYYETNFSIWHDWINCFIELFGQHRFKDDPEFGDIMKCIHDGNATDSDIQ